LESLLLCRIALGVLGTRRKLAQPPLLQDPPDRALGHLDPKTRSDPGFEIEAAPAHHPILDRVRPRLDEAIELGKLVLCQKRRAPRARAINQSFHPLGIVAINPVPQGLPVHGRHPRRLLPRGALQKRSQRQKAARLLHIANLPRLDAQIVSRAIPPRDLHNHHRLQANHRIERITKIQPWESTLYESGLSTVGIRRSALRRASAFMLAGNWLSGGICVPSRRT